ncbi:MAG: type VI secretion system baseplate subunit TssG [Holosporales bacterium]|jgi:type VI secretion system protein ImpH|nr:type VI secretion system baseplate subunit TssG [Holosporales bacterium]
MAAPIRTPAQSLIQRLQEEPYRFSLDQALVLCQKLDPLLKVRLKGAVRFSLPAQEVESIGKKDPFLTMTTHRLDLLGGQSPLPAAYRSFIASEKREGRPELEGFLNMFNHRLLMLSHHMACRRFPALQGRLSQYSPLGRMRAAFFGNPPDCASSESVGFSGRLWTYPRSLSMLEAHLHHYFDMRFRVQPFQGGWRSIEAKEHTSLGRSAHRLGEDAALGTRIWDQTYGITLIAAPATPEDFYSFLPQGPRWILLKKSTRSFLDPVHHAQLALKPPKMLTFLGKDASLSRCAWLFSGTKRETSLDPVRVDLF